MSWRIVRYDRPKKVIRELERVIDRELEIKIERCRNRKIETEKVKEKKRYLEREWKKE